MIRRALALVFGNYKLKLSALVAAVVIWLFATQRLTEQADIPVELNIQAPPGHQILHLAQNRARLVIAGPGSLVKKLRTEAGQGYLKLSHRLSEEEAEDGWTRLELAADWLTIPEDELVQLEIRRIQPGRVRLLTSRITDRLLPVRVQLTGEPRTGYEIGSVTAVPSEVRVRGPRWVLDEIEGLRTRPFNIAGIDSALSFRAQLESEEQVTVDDQSVRVPLSLSTETVRVHMDLTRQAKERTFQNVPVARWTPFDFPYVVEVEEKPQVTVTVSGLPQEVDRIEQGSVGAYVDLRSLAGEQIPVGKSSPYREKVRVKLPDDVSVGSVQAEPESLTVVLKNPGPGAQ